jgi:hypothetical protein
MLGVSAVLTSLALAAPIGVSTLAAGLAPVTGQVNLNGQPIGDVMICFDAEGDHTSCASADADGSFRLFTRGRGRGLAPGTYRVHLFSGPGGPSVPSKYQDAGTSGLVVDVDTDWNDFSFDLR